MNDVLVSKDDGISSESPTALSAGSMLRKAREASGLHVAALAVSMKVPVKKLEALEADRLDLLPDAVFVRALASSVCRALKIDSAPVLACLPTGTAPRLDTEHRGINAPFRTRGESAGWSSSEVFSKPSIFAVLALVLSALVVAFLPETKLTETTPKVEPVSTPIFSEPAGSVAIPQGENAAVVSRIVVDPKLATVSPPVMAASAAIDGNRPVPMEFGSVTALIVFKAKGPTWVQVTDAKGIVQVNRTLAAGEIVAVPGSAPVSVVIGRADMTEVEVRGSIFNLTGVAKDNVARFEVK